MIGPEGSGQRNKGTGVLLLNERQCIGQSVGNQVLNYYRKLQVVLHEAPQVWSFKLRGITRFVVGQERISRSTRLQGGVPSLTRR
jgi:hypothetical protein